MKPASRGGGLITFEGGEGAGKSTQARRLVDRLREAGVEAIATREPGGSPRAERIRRAVLSGAVAALGPFVETLMFSAARMDHLEATILPALERGAIVVCDRFIDSTRAYQGAPGRVDADLLAALERVVVGDARPDLTIVFDLDPAVGLARAGERPGGADRFEREDAGFHRHVRRAFLDIARREPMRCRVLDAGQPAEAVAEAVWSHVRARFPAVAGRGAHADAGSPA